MKLRLYEAAQTNSIGNSSTVHRTGNIDTVDRRLGSKKRRKKLREVVGGDPVNETTHFLTWTGRKFEIKPSRNGKNRAILPQTPNRFIATAKKPVKLGGSTSIIVNPTTQQTQYRIGDPKLDRKSRSTVDEGLGGIVGTVIGTYIGNKIRKRLQRRSPTKPTPSGGPWGPRPQNPTGPKIRQGPTDSGSESPPPASSNRMSAADFRSMIRKNPTLKVSGGRK